MTIAGNHNRGNKRHLRGRPANGVFTLTRTGTYQCTPGVLEVDYNITGTATNSAGLQVLYNSVVFLPGQTTTTITVAPVDDSSGRRRPRR